MDNSQIIAQAQQLLGGKTSTPYKGLALTSIPSNVVLEFLLYSRPDVPVTQKNSYIPNLSKYGFIPLNNPNFYTNYRTPTYSAPPIPTYSAPIPNYSAVRHNQPPPNQPTNIVNSAKIISQPHSVRCASCPGVV